jgi:TonB-linked SusC/RagA family outer membrane protein
MLFMKQKISILFLFLFVAFSSVMTANAQERQVVKGTVRDAATKDPLIGVSISVAGTNQGTVTDADGNYELSLPSLKSTSLKFSYLGYSPVEIALNGRQELNVMMKEDVQAISEVVVVGYGQQKKESVIGSIASMDNKSLVSLPVTNITQALAGKLPGIQIVQTSGEVGNDEADIYVRGLGTYGDARPLYVVDGIVRDNISQIDPNEIQSFNVLKDASATAVYGVKGANGVIIITTRRGTIGAPTVSFSAQAAMTEPTRIPYPLNAYQTSALKNMHKFGQHANDDYTALDIIQYRTHSSPYSHPDVSWVDEIMKKYSSMQQYNINVSGGTNLLKYFLSGGYLTQDGFYKYDNNTNFSRYNFRSNLDFTISKQFTLAFNLGSRIEKRTNPAAAWYGSWEVYRASFANSGRLDPVFNPDGSLGGSDSNTSNLVGALRDRGVFKDVKSVVETSLNAKYQMDFITKGLSARAQLAFDNSGRNRTLWNKTFAVYHYDVQKDTYKKINEDSYLSYNWADNEFDQKLYLELGLEYARTFDKHSVTGLLLANRNNRLIKTYIGYADQGLVGRITYDYDKRYFGEFNVGYNGSENFAKGKRYGFFPAFAVGWMLSNEKFISESSLSDIISMFKIRSSLGWVGNDKSGDITTDGYQSQRFEYIQTYSNAGGSAFGIGDTWYPGIRMDNIANYDVTWEVARKWDVGFNSTFFRELIGLNVDYFNEYRWNILTNISGITPAYVGAAFKPANVGIVKNQGIELELTHQKHIGKDFAYFIKGNYSFTRNIVEKRADPAGMLPYQKEEGYSIGVPSIYKQTGIFQSYEDIYNNPTQMTLPGGTEVLPGDLKYLDFNHDGMITIADAFRQGYGTVPEIQYGVTLGANYKGFDFNVLFQGSTHAQFQKNWEIMWHFSNNDNVFDKHWYYWSPEISGQEKYVRLYGQWSNNEPGGAYYGSTYSYGSGDYIRLKNLELGYTLPNKLTKKAYMSSVRFYLSGNNVFTWSTEPYLDPDNRDQRGGVMPPTRAFNIGVNVNF